MYGLERGSELKEIVVKQDQDLAVKYRVVQVAIDLPTLRREKEGLEGRLQEPEPPDRELIEMGREVHHYYEMDRERMAERLAEIDEILDIKLAPTEI